MALQHNIPGPATYMQLTVQVSQPLLELWIALIHHGAHIGGSDQQCFEASDAKTRGDL